MLEEQIDLEYEPSEDEVIEYAKHLGIDLENERDLFPLAIEGLKAPLKSPWLAVRSEEGTIYYFN